MPARTSTQPAHAAATDPAPEPGASEIGRAATHIAGGAVPPPPGPTTTRVRHPGVGATTNIRDSRLGTYMRGTEGLHTPGTESKLRLTQGKAIPGTRYRIIRWLGEGGMGVVYEAEHVDIERRVAVKILRFDLSQQAHMVQVFKDEAKAAGRLGSQYLVDLYDFGELADGRLFFAMELLDGRDLVPSAEDASMDAAALIPILRQTCKGLSVAHRAGVVHRDIKPENILTTSAPDGREQIKIVDFGISSMLAAGSQGSGGLAGTPHYMAPELILARPFDGRLDIYALGCMAYEFLTGQPPFDAKTIEHLLEMQVDDVPPPMKTLRPDLSIHPAIEAVVMKCLAKDPVARYRDTADLEAALCEAQIAAGICTSWDDLPVPELPDEPERRAAIVAGMPSPHAPIGAERPGWVWPVVAGLSTLAAAGLGTFLLMGGQPTDQERSAVDDLTAQARAEASRLNWVAPPENDPDASAYVKVLELEDIEGPAEDLADERGLELRQEFSGTLTKQADQLWDRGDQDLAAQYYFYAVVFDETNQRAFERSKVTPVSVAMYRDNVRKGVFSEVDRMGSAMAAAEVADDADMKQEKLAEAEELAEKAESDAVPAESARMRKMLDRKGRKRRPDADDVDPLVAAVTKDPPAPDPEDFALGDDAAPEEPTEPGDAAEQPASSTKKAPHRPRRSKTKDPTELLGQAERDPDKASALTDEGLAALRAGQRSKASSLFNQAISFDRKNAEALMGLSDVYFDTGKNTKAVEYAERAVRASPANRNYRLKLGDAYFKVLRYRDALEQYEKAKAKGSGRAQDRIDKVHAKLGG